MVGELVLELGGALPSPLACVRFAIRFQAVFPGGHLGKRFTECRGVYGRGDDHSDPNVRFVSLATAEGREFSMRLPANRRAAADGCGAQQAAAVSAPCPSLAFAAPSGSLDRL